MKIPSCISTRGQCSTHGFSKAVSVGLAPDGGLFLPECLPDISGKLREWEKLSYPELCYEFLGLFADIEPEKLRDIVDRSYRRFDHAEIAPVRRLADRLFVLELFHGPTLAFKDFALQLLGNLYEEQIRRTGEVINVLGATSGDTGAAAIHGLLGKEGVNIFILYPDGRVSPLQERQMTCTGAANVFPLAIAGSFDDAQRAVKEVFGDAEFSRRYRLSAVNSINLARILAQCVYYLYAWFRLPEDRREDVEFIVPTGNFGNVFAGWLARRMGLPVRSFAVAVNQNDILHRLFTTGHYQAGEVRPSLAPSMDIQVASNFERFLYYMVDCEPARVREVMAALKEGGDYVFPAFRTDVFRSTRMTDEEIPEAIRKVFDEYGYVIDPHTACGFKKIEPGRTTVVLATAHPAKFPDTIHDATGIEPKHPFLEELKAKEIVKHPVAPEKGAIEAFIADRAGGG